MKNRFHIAVPVHNLGIASQFYRFVLDCRPGRTGQGWADFDFFGHQLSLHETATHSSVALSTVEKIKVPIPHWGIALSMDDWILLIDDLCSKKVQFLVEPTVRFEGETGEQGTVFFSDPSQNTIEIKGFKDIHSIFSA